MQAVQEFLERYQNLVITSHARPDGDSIGSSLALALALENMGKTVRVVHADPPPQPYQWLPGIDRLDPTPCFQGNTEAVVVLECSDLERTGVSGLDLYPLANIDHHTGCPEYGLANWIDPSAAAVAEMVFKLLLGLGAAITPQIATNLYVGILTDTGSFQFANTTAETFHITAELARLGANPGTISERVYLSQPVSKIRLLSSVLTTLKIHPSGKIATLFLTDQMLLEVGADESETEGIVTHALSIDGVVAVGFVRQNSGENWRVSLRSKGAIDVGALARSFGGGGHVNAAGLAMFGTRLQVFQQLLPRLEQLVGFSPQSA